MKVDVFHRNNLCITTATGTTLYTKARSKAWFAQSNNGLFTNAVESVGKTNRNCRFTFARRSWSNGCNKNQFSWSLGSLFLQNTQLFKSKLCLVRSVKLKLVGRNINFCGNLSYRYHHVFLCNFYICHSGPPILFPLIYSSNL